MRLAALEYLESVYMKKTGHGGLVRCILSCAQRLDGGIERRHAAAPLGSFGAFR
jgi:hypothetical protein